MTKHAQEIAKQEPKTTALATSAPDAGPTILATDIIVPKILLMQGLSELVDQRKAQAGDFVRSTTEAKMGDDKSAPIDFIPLKVVTEWREEEKVGQKFEFRKTLPRTPANEDYPWSFFKNPQGQEFDKPGQLGATEHRRVKVINCFALLPSDIDAFNAEMAKAAETGEMPDLNKTVLPIQISFRSTSYNAGKTVTTFFAQIREMLQFNPNVKSYGYTLPLSCFGDKNDKGSYYVMKVGTPKKLDEKYLSMAKSWYERLAAMKEIKVDESKDSEVVAEGGKF